MDGFLALIILIIPIWLIFKHWIEPATGFNPFRNIRKHLIKLIKFPFWAISALFQFIYYRLFLRTSGVYGKAKFLKGYAKEQLLSSDKDGLCVDGKNRISAERSYQHVVAISPTGMGKTLKYVLPNVLSLNHSQVIVDPSAEIYNLTAGYLNSKGFNIKVINVSNVNHSSTFNPLHRATTYTDINKLSDILVRSAYMNSRGDDEFWNNSAKNILNIYIRALMNEPEKYRNLANLRYILNSFGRDGTALAPFITRNTDAVTFNEYKGFLASDDKVLLNTLSTAKTALEKFSDPELCKLTATDTIDFELLRKEKTVLFIQIPESEILYYQFFLKILYTQLFEFCMKSPVPGEPYEPIFFLLDEFGNTGAIPNFSTMITTLRKRKCSCSLVLQDFEQLVNSYGKSDASTIINGGCAGQIYLPGLSLQMCQELERKLGRATILHRERGFKISKPREMGQNLMSADEIRMMKDDQGIFIHSNFQPVKLKMTAYYNNSHLVDKTKIPSPQFHSSSSEDVEYLTL